LERPCTFPKTFGLALGLRFWGLALGQTKTFAI